MSGVQVHACRAIDQSEHDGDALGHNPPLYAFYDIAVTKRKIENEV